MYVMCVCMYVMYVCMFVCTYVRTYVCMCVCMYVCMWLEGPSIGVALWACRRTAGPRRRKCHGSPLPPPSTAPAAPSAPTNHRRDPSQPAAPTPRQPHPPPGQRIQPQTRTQVARVQKEHSPRRSAPTRVALDNNGVLHFDRPPTADDARPVTPGGQHKHCGPTMRGEQRDTLPSRQAGPMSVCMYCLLCMYVCMYVMYVCVCVFVCLWVALTEDLAGFTSIKPNLITNASLPPAGSCVRRSAEHFPVHLEPTHYTDIHMCQPHNLLPMHHNSKRPKSILSHTLQPAMYVCMYVCM